MTGQRPFLGSSNAPNAGLQEIIAFSIQSQRRIEVFTKVNGPSENLFQPEWGYGDQVFPTVRILHDGGHFDNIIDVDPPLSPRNEQQSPPPASLLGRKVLKEYGESGFHFGRIISFQLPSPTDSSETASLGVLFRVLYSDKDEADYTLRQIQEIILQPDFSDNNDFMKIWPRLKLKYNLVCAELIKHETNSTSIETLSRNHVFIKDLFGFTNNGTINNKSIRGKSRELFKICHPDKTMALPKRIRFVTARVLESTRYFSEAFRKLSNPGLVISIDPPSIKDYPTYGSPEFSQRVDPAEEEDLTQPSLDGSSNPRGTESGTRGASGARNGTDGRGG